MAKQIGLNSYIAPGVKSLTYVTYYKLSINLLPADIQHKPVL